MSMPVSNELWIFLWSICGGIILGFVFDIFRIKRRIVKTGIILISIEDLLFWILAALLFFITLYLSNEGQMRGFSIIGGVLGASFYLSAISPIVLKVSVAVIDAIIKGVLFLVNIILWPFRLSIRLLKPVLLSTKRNLNSASVKCISSVKKGTKSILKRGITRIKKIKKKKDNKNGK